MAAELARAASIKKAEDNLYQYWKLLFKTNQRKRRGGVASKRQLLSEFLVSEEFISFALMTLALKENFPE